MVIVVGSGAGGAAAARYLAEAGCDVLIIERGPALSGKDAGSSYANVDAGVRLMRTFCLGGTTMVSGGNALRCLEDELLDCGIDLSSHFAAIEKELAVAPLPDHLIGEGTRRLITAAEKSGYPVHPMPKFINPDLCCMDGRCAFGCPSDARWSALRFLRQAEADGAVIRTGTVVDDVILSHGEAAGVRSGSKVFRDDMIILAAGALETPRLLQNLSLPTTPLFADTFVSIGGLLSGIGMNMDVPMGAYIPFEGGILLPHYSRTLQALLGNKGFEAGQQDIIGMMVKIRDDDCGSVGSEIRKDVTVQDAERLIQGSAYAASILTNAGADPASLVSAPLRGSHPCGTARIGISVDTELQTAVPGLYVTDASVLPKAPGAPPILTILALARHAAEKMVT
ncbi:MAG: GMC family oxidoreductase [Methanocalculus sp. MSAO_Arc1]|uniref:FAD-dependent oxidoreductase n=1 Tax=Methanocalculus TaxID=71151 RepID=UPI000FF3469C|nr:MULTISPECIES: FAD-dependent oxidoreductase [unclassified Methanocalculus]MCP1662731.1 choline dehydrogenase-like flavoprotein [Methanocalculus sp. AMF5]RQD80682.1 MAG: GMC family oxidoreductase [Methanocalculus sp. MSAO_Arc1]